MYVADKYAFGKDECKLNHKAMLGCNYLLQKLTRHVMLSC